MIAWAAQDSPWMHPAAHRDACLGLGNRCISKNPGCRPAARSTHLHCSTCSPQRRISPPFRGAELKTTSRVLPLRLLVRYQPHPICQCWILCRHVVGTGLQFILHASQRTLLKTRRCLTQSYVPWARGRGPVVEPSRTAFCTFKLINLPAGSRFDSMSSTRAASHTTTFWSVCASIRRKLF